MKPDDPAIACHHAIRRTQRVAGKKHLGRFGAPALLVVGMDMAVPADRIFQPLFLGETQRGFNLRADVGLADAAIEIRHEDYRRDLLDQGAISGFKIWKLGIVGPGLVRLFRRIHDASSAAEDFGDR